MKIGDRSIDGDSVFFIAEAGINHGGDLDRARELVDVAADAGADAVKFQTYVTDRIVATDAPKADYQDSQAGEDTSQRELLQQYELGPEDHRELEAYCESTGITFLSSPFDEESADLLDRLDVDAIKIGSGELTNHPLLEHVAALGRPMIVSTGMATMEEVTGAYEAIRTANPDVEIAFLHCVSSYPAALDDVNLRAMETMAEELPVPVGYSDHTTAVETPGLAVAAGARIIEKHFTLDRNLAGPDHAASLEPDELSRAVSLARDAVTARGEPTKQPVAAELDTQAVSRKSLHAARKIQQGERLTEDAVAILRPATGLVPTELESVLGRRVNSELDPDEPITADVIEGDR